MLDIKLKNSLIIRFLICFIVVFLFLIIYGSKKFYYDANMYWSCGASLFDTNGKFSFEHIISGFRGWVFPTYLAICYKIGILLGDDFIGFKIINASLIAAFFSVLFPMFMNLISINQKTKRGGY